jgi:glutamate synthase domain-containing protein 1
MNYDNTYEKDMSGCALLGIFNEDKSLISGDDIIRGISLMHDRSNGLGGGFAVYGLFPEYKDLYAFQFAAQDKASLDQVVAYLEENFIIQQSEVIPHRHIPEISKHPLLRRYFIHPKMVEEQTPNKVYENITEDEVVARSFFHINSKIKGAFVMSCGKNMAAFKGVGFPEDIAKFFRLAEYQGYLWTAHGRFPTNSQAWWGGAHPFSLLDLSVIHNGEISSYGINKRYLENYGYKCTLGTDTEVICYLWDLFLRKQALTTETVTSILSAPFWEEIEQMSKEKQQWFTRLRMNYGSALLNGPFSIIVGFKSGMIGLTDRIKLRPLIAAKKNHTLYLASEESAIHETVNFQPLDKIWAPRGGEKVEGRFKVHA